MARGRSAGYDDQRDLILTQAAQLFARRGYSATSMNEVAQACGLSKATLYHYYKDKYSLLFSIADGHVSRLVALVHNDEMQRLHGEARLRAMIHAIVGEYANAQNAHRVLTDDVRFLEPDDRQQVLDKERQVVANCAAAVVELRPALAGAQLQKPLTMLLFGMVNWMFTWMRPDGSISHADMGRMAADLFIGGLDQVQLPTAQHAAPATTLA